MCPGCRFQLQTLQARVGGKEYLIANIKNPREGAGHHDSRRNIIDFTKRDSTNNNTYMRGRIDRAGLHATVNGKLYVGSYKSSVGYSGPEGYMEE